MFFPQKHKMASLDWFDGVEVVFLLTHSGLEVTEFMC